MDNYPPGLNPKKLDDFSESIELSEEQLAVIYQLKVYCGPDEELVFDASVASPHAVSKLVSRASRKVLDWRDKEQEFEIMRWQEAEEDQND